MRAALVRSAWALATCTALLMPLGAGPVEAAGGKAPTRVPGEIIVGFGPTVSGAERDRVLARVGAGDSGVRENRWLSKVAARLAEVDPSRVESVLARLEDDPRVRYAEPNYLVSADATPNDPSFGAALGPRTTPGRPSTAPAGTRRRRHRRRPRPGTSRPAARSVVVGHHRHRRRLRAPRPRRQPDDELAMWTNPGESGAGRETNGVDDDGNGYVDDWRGWDFVERRQQPVRRPRATARTSPGRSARSATTATGVAGVNWNVQDHGAQVPRLVRERHDRADAVEARAVRDEQWAPTSRTTPGAAAGSRRRCTTRSHEADAAGSLFVAAAGNDGANNDAHAALPFASYDVPNVVAVAASTQSGRRARSFSNVGAHERRPGGARDARLLDGPRRRLRLVRRHLDGDAARDRRRRAREAAASRVRPALGLKALLLRTVDAKAVPRRRSRRPADA